MALMTIIIDDIIASDESTVITNFRWSGSNGTTRFDDSGSVEFPVLSNSNQMNTAVVNHCVAQANAAGVTITPSDRKLLMGGTV